MHKIIAFLLLLVLATRITGQSTYIHCGALISMKDGKAETQNAMTIVVEGGEISDVIKGYSTAPPTAKVVDLKKYTVLPGLIDAHVHLEWEQSKTSYQEKLTLNTEDIAFRSVVYAQRTLAAGFTTVRDLGGRGVNIALRNAINSGWVQGPRILTAGNALSISGGHGDNSTGTRHDLFDPPPGAEEGIADGPDECRKAVRLQIKKGADLIKVCATGGVLSLARDGKLPHYASDELEAIVKTANDLGVSVAAHAHGAEGIHRAVLAGVNSIEHGTFMSDSTMKLMKEKHTWYVPTLTAGWAVTDSARLSPGFFPEVVRTKALGIGPKISATCSRAYQLGAPIAFGTDAGVFPHGKNALEFGFMADAGIPPAAIIQSATTNSASLLRMNQQIGSIEKGKWADIIAVEGDPLLNIRNMEKIVWVMKGGSVVR